MTEVHASFWRRHPWLTWIGGGALVLLAVLAGTIAFLLHRAEPFVRAQIVEQLQNHFHARVELDSFHMSLAHGLRAEGRGLRIWPPNSKSGAGEPQADQPPLIRLEQFRFHAPLHLERGKPFHIALVELQGMEIHVPPRPHKSDQATAAPARKGESNPERFEVATIQCTDAHLIMDTNNPAKAPLDFAISRLTLDHVSSRGAMGFDADLTNPRPTGQIHTTGNFGPWVVDDPGESPVQGQYTFDHADLGDFKGIAGILSSDGKYDGTLNNIAVDGETDVPDFRLTQFGHPMHLHTTFEAKVDGTNGDTFLEPVDAMLGQSHFTARGDVVRVPIALGSDANNPQSTTGRDINLDINVDRARIEDFLCLTSKDCNAMLSGPVVVKAKLTIPTGSTPVPIRMGLKGTFLLNGVRFSSERVQEFVRELSLRGQGRPKDVKTTDPASIHSTMRGGFSMASGTIHLPDLLYEVPGATVHLNGTYGVLNGALNFTGQADLEAKVSQMVGGFAGLLLKPADRFFDKKGPGTQIPIKIGGTRKDPEFGLNFHHDQPENKDQTRPVSKDQTSPEPKP